MGRGTCQDKKLYFSRGGAMIALVKIWSTNPTAPQGTLPRDFYECVVCGLFHLTSSKGELAAWAKKREDELKQHP